MNTNTNGLDGILNQIRSGEVEITDSLPVFGGDEPGGGGVWSWDADRVLIGTCADDLRIVTREEWATFGLRA